MATGNPVLGRKIVKVDPDGRRMACCHGLFVDFRQAAGECFDDDIAGFAMLKRSHPAAHFDECFQIRLLVPGRYELRIALGVQRWAQWLERGQVVDPQTDSRAVLVRQLSRKPPTDADVTEIVDDVAEDIPAAQGGRQMWGGFGRHA